MRVRQLQRTSTSKSSRAVLAFPISPPLHPPSCTSPSKLHHSIPTLSLRILPHIRPPSLARPPRECRTARSSKPTRTSLQKPTKPFLKRRSLQRYTSPTGTDMRVFLLTRCLSEWQSTTSNRPPSCARETDSPSLRLAFDFEITSGDRDDMQE